MNVSIIIVNYNTKELTRNCLQSIYEQTKDISFEVIVSDNGSTDGSIEMVKSDFPQVILIENKANLGFGAANNRGLDIAKGKYIFYLNSDTVLLNNAVKMFFDFWENAENKEKIGALGGNLLDKDSNITHSYGDFPSLVLLLKKIIRRWLALNLKCILKILNLRFVPNYKNQSEIFGEVEYITGADLFVKNDKYARYDERFFLYSEECDLQFKLYIANKARIIISEPKIIHLQGCSDNTVAEKLSSQYSSFGKIQMDISNVKFLKYNIGKVQAFFAKIMTTFFWLHPVLFFNTRKYLKELWAI